MGKSGKFAEKWNKTLNALHQDEIVDDNEMVPQTGMQKAKKILSIVGRVIYHLRKVFMAAPVIYYALKIANYSMEHLPEMVGINLQSNGTYAQMITRSAAVNGSLMLTGACLVLMLFSRKALQPWVVSIFTLIVPIFLILTNIYPC